MLRVGESVHATIDVIRRERIRRNHTATHLLHWALRLVLGEHATQAGSSVSPDRLRFDFTHFEAMTREQIGKVERLVNAKVFENHPVRAYETSLATAREIGVTALFGEKYSDFVRVLEVGNFSKELCGGTHISATTEIGLLKIVSESSSARTCDASRRSRASMPTSSSVPRRPSSSRPPSDEGAAQGRLREGRSSVKRVKELESGAQRFRDAISENAVGGFLSAASDGRATA